MVQTIKYVQVSSKHAEVKTANAMQIETSAYWSWNPNLIRALTYSSGGRRSAPGPAQVVNNYRAIFSFPIDYSKVMYRAPK